MSTLGLDLSDDEFDLVNKTYPHKEGMGEVDRGIGYLEFVSMLTGKLTYVPGAGVSLPVYMTRCSEYEQAKKKEMTCLE